MDCSRRKFLQRAALVGAGLTAARSAQGAPQEGPVQQGMEMEEKKKPASRPGSPAPTRQASSPAGAPLLVETPDVSSLPFEMDGGVKVFRLVAEPVKRRIVPFKTMDVWGYNGSCPGPPIQAIEGDRVRIIFQNRLPEATTVHWHGLEVPLAMDGVPFISQPPVLPGEKFAYEFDLHQNGTFFYHSHGAMQEMMGMIGMFIIHPKTPHQPRVDHDFGIVLQEWAILPNNTVPNSSNMEFNWLTFNGVSGPAITPMLVRLGSRARIRIVNLGMDHHPIHLHGNQFYVTGTEGGRAPESTWYPINTVLVGVAQARDIEFEAKYAGDWMLHCHLPHHMMNSMSDLLGGRALTTAATNESEAMDQMVNMASAVDFEHKMPSPAADNANSVPGFPQDAFMEMAMDQAVAKPENYGLPENWSANMMGMMTLVRVLPPQLYDKIAALRRQPNGKKPTEQQHPG